MLRPSGSRPVKRFHDRIAIRGAQTLPQCRGRSTFAIRTANQTNKAGLTERPEWTRQANDNRLRINDSIEKSWEKEKLQSYSAPPQAVERERRELPKDRVSVKPYGGIGVRDSRRNNRDRRIGAPKLEAGVTEYRSSLGRNERHRG